MWSRAISPDFGGKLAKFVFIPNISPEKRRVFAALRFSSESVVYILIVPAVFLPPQNEAFSDPFTDPILCESMSNPFPTSPPEISPASHSAPPVSNAENSPVSLLDDWQLVLLLLPTISSFDDYRPREIADAIGEVSIDTLINWAKQIWPNHQGHWMFSRDEAQRLICKYMRHGRRRHSRETLEFLVERKRAQRALGQRVMRELALQVA